MSKYRRWTFVAFVSSSLLASAAGAQVTTPLTQAEVVALAAKHNPGLQTSLLNLESARWEVYGQEARYAPVLLLDASATRSKTPSLFTEGVALNRTTRADAGAEVRKRLVWGTDLTLRIAGNWQETKIELPADLRGAPLPAGTSYGLLAKLSLKQPLLRGSGRAVNEAELLAARARRTSVEHAQDRVASQLVRDVLTAYWELWYAEASLKIEEESRAVAVKQRDDAQARADTGGLAPSEVLAFETEVAMREEGVLSAQLNRRQRELELFTRLGIIEKPQSLGAAEEELRPESVLDRQVAFDRMLGQSAELKELEASLALARLQSKTAADPQRARLDLDSYVQAQGLGNDSLGESVEQFGAFEAVSAFVGLTYEAPLSDHSRRAASAKARLAVDVAEQNLKEARQRMVSELDLSLERRRAAESKVGLAERTVLVANKQLEAQKARFSTGAATPLAVLEAESQVRNAQIRVARAQTDLAEAMLALQHLTGDLLPRYAAISR